MGVSNWISIGRLILAIPLSFAVYHSEHLWVAIGGIIVFVSDYADGYYARKYNEISEMGKILDPIADKAVVVGVVLALLFTERTPLWFVSAVVARDIIIVIGGIILKRKLEGFTPPSNLIGKLTINVLALVFLLQYTETIYSYTWGSAIGIIFLVLSLIFYMARTWGYLTKTKESEIQT